MESRSAINDSQSAAAAVAPSRMPRWWQWYLEMLNRYPVRAKCLTAGFTGMISEVLQTRVKGEPVTLHGLVKQLILGILVRSPLQQGWLVILNRIFKGADLTKLSNVLKKVAVHESIDPFFCITYMTLLRTLDGNSIWRAFALVKLEYPAAMRAQWSVWPATQIVNFKYVPDDLQLPLVNTIAIFMNAYLTYLSMKRKK
eukprot:GEMP01062797.1.p1 GENE.GEMP01062797.1~~GEMP01062797.1.p1  ORF type:complete len:199 (+),score=36.28 GEMP01062797.1:311-907(+)